MNQLVAETVRSHPRPGSNSNGNLVAAFNWQADTSYSQSLGLKEGHTDALQSQQHPAILDGTSVRRLMPVECERLQALPDGWTDLGGTPDSRRYAALGDAVTASVAEWIGRRILAHEIARAA